MDPGAPGNGATRSTLKVVWLLQKRVELEIKKLDHRFVLFEALLVLVDLLPQDYKDYSRPEDFYFVNKLLLQSVLVGCVYYLVIFKFNDPYIPIRGDQKVILPVAGVWKLLDQLYSLLVHDRGEVDELGLVVGGLDVLLVNLLA